MFNFKMIAGLIFIGSFFITNTTADIARSHPKAKANGPYFGSTDEPVYFKSNGSKDVDGFIVSYFWDFGDNTFSKDPNPAHKYNDAGDYHAILTVVDNSKLTSSDKVEVLIHICDISERMPKFFKHVEN